MWVKNSISYRSEVEKLIALNNPRISRIDNGIMIDCWCDGNEMESEKIMKLSSNLNRKFKVFLESRKNLEG